MESGKEPGTLSEVVAELRKLWPQTDWAKCDDPLAELHALRYGPVQNRDAEAFECAARLCEEMADEHDEPVSDFGSLNVDFLTSATARRAALQEAARRIRGLKGMPF